MAVAEKVVAGTAPAAAPVTPGSFVDIRLADSEKHTMTLNLPAPLRDAIKAAAEKQELSDTAVARAVLAEHWGFNILDNASTRMGKYVGLTKEEKAKARKDERDQKNQRVGRILEAIGSKSLTEEQRAVLAQLGIV